MAPAPEVAGGTELDGVQFGLVIETVEEQATAVAEIQDGRFLLQTSTDEEPVDGAASAAALQLAMLVELGPRPHPGPDAPTLLADGVKSPDRAGVFGAWSAEDREGTPLARADAVVWTAWAAWPGEDDDTAIARSITVVDAGDEGIMLVDIDDDVVVARAVRPTDVWVALCSLLPYPFELSRR